MLTFDRHGNPWKVYRNGRMLCAASRPYHHAYDAENRATDGPCHCVNRIGEIMASFTMRFDQEGGSGP